MTIFNDLERIKANPSHLDGYADEKCDGGDHDLYEPVTRFVQGYMAGGREHDQAVALWCPDCRQQFTTNQAEHEIQIGRSYWGLSTKERCDECSMFRCNCPCDGCGSVRCRCP